DSPEQFDAGDVRIPYDSADALVADIRTRLPDGADADDASVAERDPTTTQSQPTGDDGEAAGPGDTDPCQAVSLLALDPADVVLVLPAVLGPDEVTVVVHDTDDGRRLTVVDDATCTTAFDRLL